MPNRFASQQDYSQVFQYLVQQNQRYLESAAQRVDAKREADWAARDALMFTRYKEGKISGSELMAHINKRLRQSFAGAEKDRWRKLAVEYGNAIADERAESAYAETENINALISHYAKRLSSTVRGTPEYTQLAERLRSLREQRSRDDITDGARRIIRAIEKGKATKRDLLQFYRRAGRTATGDIRQEALDRAAELRGQIRQETMQTRLLNIDGKVDAGQITPQEGADQMAAVLKRFNVAETDPVKFAEYQNALNKMRATPDVNEIERAEAAVIAGTMSPQEYQKLINQWASAIAPYDMHAAWELRQAGSSFLEDNATPIEGGVLDRANQERYIGTSTIGVVKNLKGTGLRYISQFDGSKYNGYNCAMASGAMMAHAMGIGGLSGADLRALSGDTSGGTTVFQVAQALQNGQIGAQGIDARSNWGFDEFKQRLLEGSTAVLGGWTGALPAGLNSTTGAMGHSVFIAGYDPKKGFLVLDPSGKGGQRRAWWPESVVRSFAFSGHGWQGGFNGYAAVSPRGTLKPGTLERAGGSLRWVDVTAPPSGQVPGATPITHAQQPSPKDQNKTLGEMLTDRERRRLRDAGIKPGKNLDTKQEVEALIDDNAGGIAIIQDTIDQWQELHDQGGMDEDGVIEMLDGRTLSREDIEELQRDLIYLHDGQVILYEANGNEGKANDAKAARGQVLLQAAVINTMERNRLQNEAMRTALPAIDNIIENRLATPQDFAKAVGEIADAAQLLGVIDEDETVAGEDATAAEKKIADLDNKLTGDEVKEAARWGPLVDVLESPDEYKDYIAWGEALVEAASPLMGAEFENTDERALMAALIESSVQQRMVDEGAGTWIVADGSARVVPLKESGSVDANGDPVMVPDLATEPELQTSLQEQGLNVRNLPPVVMAGPAGDPVVAVGVPQETQYKDFTFLQSTGQDNDAMRGWLRDNGYQNYTELLLGGGYITDLDISSFGYDDIARLMDQGILNEAPMMVPTVVVGDDVWYESKSMNEDTGEVTTSWHLNSLPYTPYVPEDESLTVPGGTWLGVDSRTPGRPVAAPVTDETLMQGGTMGQDVINGGLSEAEFAQYVQEAVNDGRLSPEQSVPDPQDPTRSITVGIDHPSSPANSMPDDIFQYLDTKKAEMLEEREKLASMMPPDWAARLPEFTDSQIEEAMKAYGVTPDPERPRAPADMIAEALKENGITIQEEEETDFARQQQDHIATTMALGAAEKANQEAKRAAALKEAQEAMEREVEKQALPTIKVPDYTAKAKAPIPKPRSKPTPTPTPTPTPERKQSGGSSMLDLQPKMTPKPTPEPKKRTITPQPTKPEML